MLKTCSKCSRTLSEEEFAFRNRLTAKRHSWCRQCCSVYTSSWYKRNGRKHNTNTVLSARKRRRRKHIAIKQWLTNKCCVDCGEKDVIVLQFDHVRGTKIATISDLISANVSWTRILEEIEKCEIRCSNCHLRRHYKNRKMRE